MKKTCALFMSFLAVCVHDGYGGGGSKAVPDGDIMRKARAIHDRIATIDTHVDFEASLATPGHDPGQRLDSVKVDLVKMREGGLDAVFFAVWTPQKPLSDGNYAEAYDLAMDKFNAVFRMCAAYNADLVELARSPADVERIAKTGKRAALLGVENGFPIGGDIGRLRFFYDLGARYITLTHIGHNQIGDSSNEKKGVPAEKYGGLSDFGKEVVREMNRLGMMIDVSHAARSTFYDVIALSKAPVIASHSGCRALCDVARNLDDEQLKAIAENGGTVQIVGYGGYLRKPAKEATLADFADHIDYAVGLIGVDHVGIGSDFDGGGGIPGFNDASECVNVTVELLKRGYSEKDIEKIWGGNLLRVWRQVEKRADREHRR